MDPAVERDAAAWDAALLANRGHLLQSWRWGEFKRRSGWEVDRVAVEDQEGVVAQAQILTRRRGPVGVGYIPRGPAVREGETTGLTELFVRVDARAKRGRTLFTIVEPNEPLPFVGRFKQAGFVKGGDHIQPGRTVKVPLLPDDALLSQMRQNTRYSVRLAMRRGVQVRRLGDGASLDDFYRLLTDTADRNSFAVHDRRYYADFLDLFGDDALCLFAYADGELAAALIAARFGEEAMYMYGASSTQNRAHGAGTLIQFEAMRWAREAGCLRYDLWGIPMDDPDGVSADGTRLSGSKGDDWGGLFRFKTGFGGEIVTFPPVLERRHRRVSSFLAKRLTGAGREL